MLFLMQNYMNYIIKFIFKIHIYHACICFNLYIFEYLWKIFGRLHNNLSEVITFKCETGEKVVGGFFSIIIYALQF